MDNSFYLSLLAEAPQGRLLEERGRNGLLPGQPHLTFPVFRKGIVTGGSFLIRAGEALKGIGTAGETARFSANGPTTSTSSSAPIDV
ncbi:MAG: hypothetical protein WBB65_01755 [Anaerolineales bacterium]